MNKLWNLRYSIAKTRTPWCRTNRLVYVPWWRALVTDEHFRAYKKSKNNCDKLLEKSTTSSKRNITRIIDKEIIKCKFRHWHRVQTWEITDIESIKIDIDSSLLWHHGSICATDCDERFISSSSLRNGTVTSLNYPSSYPAHVNCRYTFIALGRGERIQIIFTDLDLYYPTGNPKDPVKLVTS